MDPLLSAIGLGPGGLIFCVFAVLSGAYLKGYTGFGASMLWVTSLSLVLPPLQVVPMVLMFEVASSVFLMPRIWREVNWASIGALLIGTWLATPLGIYALANLAATPIRLTLAVVVFLAAVLILRGFALRRVPGTPATVGVGLMAGCLNGSMGIVGPPVILFYFSSPIGIAAGRASIIAYFIGTDTVGTAMFAVQGLIGQAVYWRTLLFLPLLFIGVSIGHRGFVKTEPEAFKRIALFVLMALSLMLFARAIWSG